MKKIGIITIQSLNFGNRLQNYALQKVLEQLNADVYTVKRKYGTKNAIIVGISNVLKTMLGTRIGLFKRFDRKYIRFGKYYAYPNSIQKGLESEYDILVTGSDQVWNPHFTTLVGSTDLLDFETKSKKASYAASFGISELPNEFIDRFTHAFEGYESISVREQDGVEIVNGLVQKKPTLVLDPTLLLGANEWRKIARKPKNMPTGEYTVVCFLGKDVETSKEAAISECCKESDNVYDILCKDKKGRLPRIGPSEFLWIIDNAKLVLTNSFHTTVFSILFRVPVRTYPRDGIDMSSRIVGLANTVGVENMFSANGVLELDKDVPYTEMDQCLATEKQRSIEYLKGLIE